LLAPHRETDLLALSPVLDEGETFVEILKLGTTVRWKFRPACGSMRAQSFLFFPECWTIGISQLYGLFVVSSLMAGLLASEQKHLSD
jgi:hypothetical protein